MGCPCEKCVVLAICNDPCENFIRYALRWKRRAMQIKLVIVILVVSTLVSIGVYTQLELPLTELPWLVFILILILCVIFIIIALLNEIVYFPRSLKRMLDRFPYAKLVEAGISEPNYPPL